LLALCKVKGRHGYMGVAAFPLILRPIRQPGHQLRRKSEVARTAPGCARPVAFADPDPEGPDGLLALCQVKGCQSKAATADVVVAAFDLPG